MSPPAGADFQNSAGSEWAPPLGAASLGTRKQWYVAQCSAGNNPVTSSIQPRKEAVMNLRVRIWAGLGMLLLVLQAHGQTNQDWTTPIEPFRIAANLYYVASKALASYLVVTPQGNILINSSLETSVPLIRRSVQKLGFRFADIKILLISHAHYDHDAGSAEVLRLTHAKYMVMDGDVPVVESGGKADFAYGAAAGT